jgi:hypothetical protein
LNRVTSGGNLEECGDEGGLSPDIVSADAPNLSFPDHGGCGANYSPFYPGAFRLGEGRTMAGLRRLDELFAGRHLEREIVVLCVRWHLRFKLSFRDLVEMMAERDLAMARTTIMRSVHHYVPMSESWFLCGRFQLSWRREYGGWRGWTPPRERNRLRFEISFCGVAWQSDLERLSPRKISDDPSRLARFTMQKERNDSIRRVIREPGSLQRAFAFPRTAG